MCFYFSIVKDASLHYLTFTQFVLFGSDKMCLAGWNELSQGILMMSMRNYAGFCAAQSYVFLEHSFYLGYIENGGWKSLLWENFARKANKYILYILGGSISIEIKQSVVVGTILVMSFRSNPFMFWKKILCQIIWKVLYLNSPIPAHIRPRF